VCVCVCVCVCVSEWVSEDGGCYIEGKNIDEDIVIKTVNMLINFYMV